MTEALLPLLTVRCFWYPACGHTVHGVDPDEAHRLMEAHYSSGAHDGDFAAMGIQ